MRRFIGRMIEWFLRYDRVVEIQMDEEAKLPHRKYDTDGGYDLYVSEAATVPPKSVMNIASGVKLAPKSPIWFEIKKRSSTFHKKGLEVIDAVIDNGFRGELYCVVFNPGDMPVEIEKHTRVCQIIPHLVYPVKFHKVEVLSDSDREDQGFGSTGE